MHLVKVVKVESTYICQSKSEQKQLSKASLQVSLTEAQGMTSQLFSQHLGEFRGLKMILPMGRFQGSAVCILLEQA